MKEAQTISRQDYEKRSMRYDFLREEGLRFAQHVSGSIWTDYNYHDPGVTFLEQLCYAITDLGYRTQFDMHDLLLHQSDDYDLVGQNLFLGPSQIFPCDPFTVTDYRRLLIDRVKQVRNAWVTPVRDDPAGYQGLYRILVQCSEDLDALERTAVEQEVAAVFHAHRNLCHDLKEIIIMEEDVISLAGKIFLAPDALGELVLAQITARLDHFLNPEVPFQHPATLLTEGKTPEEIFEGPLPIYGFIDPKALPVKLSTLYVSQIRDLILETEGVQDIADLTIYKNGVRVHGDTITFDEKRYPVAWNKLEGYAEARERFEFFKDQVQYDIDPISALQLYQSLASGERGLYLKQLVYEEAPLRSSFKEADIRAYYSIQQELPDTYGLREQSLPGNASPKRRAQAKQLKAYLAFFDQIMANYLAQLSSARKLLSVDKELHQTYFYQVPSDIPKLKEILVHKEEEAYLEALQRIHAEVDHYAERRNRVLDHLLARFSERFPTDLLKKFEFKPGTANADDLNEEIISAKIQLLNHILFLNKLRATGIDYTYYSWGSGNISGIERRICLNMHIADMSNRSLVEPLLEMGTMERETPGMADWKVITLATEDGQYVDARIMPLDTYEEDACSFFANGSGFIKDLFLSGISARSYKIVHTLLNGMPVFATLFNSPYLEVPAVVYLAQEEARCREMIEKTISKLNDLNHQCEGLHIVEHLLLRPQNPVSFRFNVFGADGEVCMTSFRYGSFEAQRDLADDIPFLGARRENYGIVEDASRSRYQIILYNAAHEPVGLLQRAFYYRADAEAELEKMVSYLAQIHVGLVEAEEVIEVAQESGVSNDFPDAFEFSHTYSVVLPDWPSRFQNGNFRKLLRQILDEHGMAHQKGILCFINVEEMAHFEEVYAQWLKERSNATPDLLQLDLLSLQLAQMLLRFRGSQGE